MLMFITSLIASYLAVQASNQANEAIDRTAKTAEVARDLSVQNRILLAEFRAEQLERERERVERIDQSCRSDEREHLVNVRNLKQTYNILSDPKARQLIDPGLLELIVTISLPQTEEDARTDQAPEFCDNPGVGLPEPDPKVPKKRDFSFLLNEANSPP